MSDPTNGGMTRMLTEAEVADHWDEMAAACTSSRNRAWRDSLTALADDRKALAAEVTALRKRVEELEDLTRSLRRPANAAARQFWGERNEALKQRDELLAACKAINNCISFSDSYGTWVLVGRAQTQPALEQLRAAIAGAKKP